MILIFQVSHTRHQHRQMSVVREIGVGTGTMVRITPTTPAQPIRIKTRGPALHVAKILGTVLAKILVIFQKLQKAASR